MTDPAPLALVTGGLHRIGAAIAARLAGAGYALVLHSRSGGAPDAPLVETLTRLGTDWTMLTADLAAPGAADSLIDGVLAAKGRMPSLLVNNASMFGGADVAVSDAADLTRHLTANLIAPVRLAQRVAADGATCCIINILDQRVVNPVPDQFAYTLSKQALWQATRTLAIALAPHARVNGVAPGLTLPTADYAPGQMDRVAREMPLARLATPDDIAEAVMYLVHAKAITGQTIFVDGGANLRSFERDFVAL